MIADPAALPLPALREDLRFLPGASEPDGSPAWLIYDPLAHRYYEIDATGLAVLRHWRPGTSAQALAEEAGRTLGRAVGLAEVAAIHGFAEANGLVAHRGGWRALGRQLAARRVGWAGWLLHNYLFIRIPLVRPQRVLVRTLPTARRLAGRTSLTLVALAGTLGLYLASRQWDVFASTFLHFLTWEGFFGYLAALAGVKLLHELGHAYVAVHHGCRIPTMGVAFMVGVPVLYTDTTDAWALRDRRARLAIDAAGVAVELAVAAVATLAWSFLPDGTWRSAAFFVATATWTLSLAINLNPLMRFDGYYLACDATGIANLQPRAFALTRWAVREVLFGLSDPCPEPWGARRRAGIVAYGLAVWLYRLVLFTGIAVMVYAAAFKVLGLVLFAVEIGYFVLRPIAAELAFWWENRDRIAPTGRARWSAGMIGATLLLLVVPLPGRVEIPAIAEPARSERLTASAPAQVIEVAVGPGTRVGAGDVLIRLASPRLAHEVATARIRLALTELRQGRRTADATDRATSLVLDGEQSAQREKLAGLERQQAELVVRAAFDGLVAELAPDLQPGLWVGKGEDLGTLVAAGRRQVRGLVPEAALARLRPRAAGTFTPDAIGVRSTPVVLATVSDAAVAAVEIPYLASTLGGPVAVREEKGVGAVPVEAQYTAVLEPPGDGLRLDADPGIVRGVVTVEAAPESVAARFARRALAVLVRESGF